MRYALQKSFPRLRQYTAADASFPVSVSANDKTQRDAVISLVTTQLQQKIEAALSDSTPLIHAKSVGDAARIIRESRIRVLLISTEQVGDEARMLERLLRVSASILRVVALVDDRPPEPVMMLRLGASGLREVVDLRDCQGWKELRYLLEEEGDPITLRVENLVKEALVGASVGTRRFFSYMTRSARRLATVRELACGLEIRPSTLASRFHRARLPSPKTLLSATRLLLARAMLEDSKASLSAVAHALNYSSPQAFARHIQHVLGFSPREFRTRLTFDGIVSHYVEILILRHCERFRVFNPFGSINESDFDEAVARPTYIVH